MIKKFYLHSIDVSTNWAKRSKTEFGNNNLKGLFGIVQGGLYKDLRIESIQKLTEIRILMVMQWVVLAVGEPQKEMFKILNETMQVILPKKKPRYLMGVGTPSDILRCS